MLIFANVTELHEHRSVSQLVRDVVQVQAAADRIEVLLSNVNPT